MAAAMVARVVPAPPQQQCGGVACQLPPPATEAPAASAHFQACCADPPSRVLSNLFIGSRDTEACLEALQAAGVTHVLQVGVELAPSHPGRFAYKQLSCSDAEDHDIVAHFADAFAFIDEGRNNGGVLVHCAQGVSRSASVLVGYLMAADAEQQQQQEQGSEEQEPTECRERGQGAGRRAYDAALQRLRAARPAAAPNPGFALQLAEFGAPAGCACRPERWRGWSAARAADSFAAASVSRRREVCGLSDMVRRFHMADVGEEDTVFDVRDVLL